MTISRYIYKVESDSFVLTKRQTFVQGFWMLVDAAISIATLGFYAGRFSNKYMWQQIEVNTQKFKDSLKELEIE